VLPHLSLIVLNCGDGWKVKTNWIVPFFVLWASVLPASEKGVNFQSAALKSIDCQIQVPTKWSVYDQSNRDRSSWVITPDDLNRGPYTTGVRIESLAKVESLTGAKASEWVAARGHDKSTSLPVISSETGPTNDYFQVRRLVTEEVYSPGRTEYTTYRKIYTWYWSDKHDVVICIEARTPGKSWKSMSPILERISKLEFDVPAWEKKLATAKE